MDPAAKSPYGPLALVLPHEPALLRRARRLTGCDAQAYDLLQDAYERVLRTTRMPRTAREFRPWMLRVLTNLWIDQVRVTRRWHHIPLTDSLLEQATFATDPGSLAEPAITLEDVQAALAQVPEPNRSVYWRHATEGRSYQELASELGIPAATVGTRILRARRCLRRILERRQAPLLRPRRA